MTRQNHHVRMLARMTAILLIVSLLAGLQVSAAGQTGFSDVKESQSYYADICWAAERGIVTGSNGKFRPEARVSVQQFFTMLSRSIPVSEDEKAATDTSQDSMLYHLRRAARNGWTDGFGYVPELYKDANVAAGLAWYAALRANGTQIYSGALYGEQSNRRIDGMNAAKKLGLAAADADAAKAITRAEAVQIIRAAAGNTKTLPKPEIVTEMQDTVIGLDQSDVNLVYTNLMLVPAPIRTAFREDGWKLSFDAAKIAKYSDQNKIWGIHGMTVYRQKTIYLADTDALLHEMGHYYQEKLRSSGMDVNVYTTFEKIRSEERWCGSMLANNSGRDGAEFFAEAFAFYMQCGKVRSDPSGEDAKTGLESQRYFDDLAERGWIE